MKQKYLFSLFLIFCLINSYSQVNGDFRSTASGNWESASSWETWSGGVWIAASNYPGQIAGTYSITIQTAHTITVSSNLNTTSIGDLTVNGTLDLQAGTNPKQISLSTTLLYLTSTGILNFSNQKTKLYLPTNAVIKVDSGGNISGACSNNTEIYIDNKLIAVCNGGGGNVLTFGEIVAGSGTLNANITSPASFTSTICNGVSISLSGGYTGTPNGTVNYLWSVKDPSNTAVVISNSTLTSTSFTPSQAGQYTISFTVTDGSSFSNTETKTVTVQSVVGSGSIATAQTICSGTSPSPLTSTTDGTGDGTITYEWQTNASGSYATIGGATAATYSPAVLTATTSYKRRTVSTLNGVACYSAYTTPVTITVGDTTPPVLTAEANQNATLNASCMISIPNLVDGSTATDNCSGITITQNPLAGTTQAAINNGTINVAVTATDTAGNTDSKTVIITAKDTTIPTLTAGANQTANTAAGLCTASVVVTNATFSDNCSGSFISYSLSGATIKTTTAGQVGTFTFNKGVTTINYTVTDAAGNTTTDSKTVTVTDNIFPTLTAGANLNANTDAGLCTSAIAITDATFSDNCTGSTISYSLSGATITATTSGQIGTFTFNKGVTTITYTVTDAAGNTTINSKTVTVTDNINPTISAGANQTANTDTGLCTAAVTVADATFNDNCSGSAIAYTLSGATTKTSTSGQVGTFTFNKGITTINYTVTDAVGNTITGSKTVTVTDNINPTITAGVNQTANTAAGLCTASVAITDAVFSDNCTGSTISYSLIGATIKVTTAGQVGTYTFNKGVTTINYTVTDTAGNTTSSSKTVTVTDNINPTISVGANQTANTDTGLCTAAVTVADATFNDNCSGSAIAYTLSGATTKTSTSGQVGTFTFNKGVTTINYTVTDAVGNTITGSKTVTVTDNINPTITAGVNQTANTAAGLCTASVAVTDAVFSDNCTGFTISYSLSGATIKVTTAGQVGTYTFNKGVTTINYTVTDTAGNTTNGSKTVTVTDNINPTITVGANQTANTAAGLCTASVAVTDATFSDNCTGSTISYSLSGATITATTLGQVGTFTFNKGITTINYTVTDSAGNTIIGSKTVTVTDNINPTITAGANQTANTDAGLCTSAVAITDATFSDNCTGATITYTLSGATIAASTSGQVGTFAFNKGVTTINYTVTDAVGNTTTGSKTITVTDNINPTINTGANQTTNTAAGLCTASVTVTDATFSDNCNGSAIAYTLSGATTKASTSGQVGTYIFNKGVTTINYTVTDAAGRTITGSKTITVNDNINPSLTPGANQTANTAAGLCTASVAVTNATFSDNCTGSTISYSLSGATIKATTAGQVGTYTFNKGITSIDYTVTDAAGNTTIGSKTVTVTDNINPTLAAGANQTANTDAGLCTSAVTITDATFSDNCTGATIAYTLSGATIAASTSGQVGTYVFNKGVTTINYTVTDAAGNTTSNSKTVTVTDNINPTLTPGVNQSANTDAGLCSASVVITDAVFSDNCSGSTIAYTLSGATTKASTSGQVGTYIFNKGVTTINYTVTDAAGRTITGSKTITVTDNINPSLTPGANQTANTAVGLCTASVAVTNATFSDNCTGSTIAYSLSGATIKATTAGQVGTYTFNKGVTNINYTVTDAAGNTTTASATVTVADNINPSITAIGANQTANTAAGTCAASVAITDATFSDNCAGSTISYSLSGATIAVTTSGQVGTYTFNKGVTNINYTVTDAVGNTTTGSKTVTITDNINPTLTPGVNQSANTDAGLCTASVAITDAVFSDNCSGSTIAYTLSGATIKASTSGQVGTYIFNQGATTINYTVTDAVGRTTTGTKTVTVNDNITPTISCPSNVAVNVGAGTCTASVVTSNPTTADNCSVTKLTWTLTGATTGNSAATGINNLGTKTFNLGTTTVTYTVYDAANNSSTCSYTVIVTDNIDPAVIATSDIISTTSVDGTGNCTAAIAITNASTSDNCSVAKLTWSMSGATTANSSSTGINQIGTYTFNTGTTTIVYTVTDGSGRTSTDTMLVTVNDNEKPTAPSLPNITAQCSVTVNYPVATDNCSGTVTTTTGDPTTYNTQGSYIIHWSFKDSSGNETLANQNAIVDDTTAPVPNVTNLTALNVSGCQLTSLTAPTATDNCIGSITGTPSISLPFTTQGTTVITWTYDDGNGNTKTQTQNLTLTAPPIDGGSLLGYLSEIETQANAKDNIAITSCPDDINPITFNLSGQIGTIIQWEKFEAGNTNWQIIPNTTNTYSFVFDFQNTKSTLFRVLVQVGDCTKYSNMVDVHAVPPDVPPILEQNSFTICLNDNVTLVAHNGYTSASAADDGGDFNSGQFPNKWDPTQWKIDGKTAGAQWTAAGNNTKFNNWAGTNNHPVGTLYRIEYDSSNLKFGIAHGNYNSPEYIAAYPPGNPTTLETPIFSLVGLKTASIDFDQAYNLHAGDIAKLELSLDGGATYTVVLQNLTGTSPHALSWGDTHGTPVPYPYQAPKSNNSTTTYFNFQNDNSSFDISDYIGNDNVRVKWTFFGTTDESAWAIDNITIPVKPYSDQLEWTDGIGTPGNPPLASGTLDVAYTFAPTAPGVHQYGATSIINGCRAYDPSGTALATVNVNYSYAGTDITPASGKCGGTTVTLNAYDNTKTANENKTNGAYPGATNTFSDDPGTGQIGSWSIVSSTSSCGTGSFSNINDSKTTFTGAAGTYILRWTVAGCTDDVQVTLENCQVIDFDGDNDFVNFDNNYNLNSSFSINVWVKPQPGSGTNIQTIFSKRNGDNLSATNGYDIRLDNNNYISFNWNAGGSLKASHPISTSRWYHITVTFNGSTYKLYIDGLEVGSTSGSQPVTNTYNCLLGGMYHNASTNDAAINFYSGWMDELQIWNTALTPDQIHQIMNQKIEANGTAVRGAVIPIDIYGLTWANLQGYYRMDNLNCGYLKPYSSKGVDGRLLNINTSQSKTAPLPYTTIRNGNWTDRGTSTTPWLYGDSVWDYPNSTGINGQAINWNIVVQSNNLNSDDKDITLLGLISNTGTTLKIVAPGTQNESNSGHLLWLTHYLKLDGFIDLIGESQLLQKRYYSYPEQYSESIFDEASTGYIERDQQGNKNSYNYNYWSSPVSIRGGANNSAYTISSILRDGTDSSNPKVITFGDGAYFADGALSSPIKISNRWIWTYNSLTPDSNSNWQNYYQWQYKAGTGIIPVAEGFTMKGTGGSAPITSLQNYVFTGKPNSGTINKFLAIQQTYLVGNPYPSALDADEFIKDNLKDCAGCRGTTNAFGGALYFWDHFGLSNNHILAQYEGGYATYTLTGGVRAVADDPLNVNNNAVGAKLPQRYIPVGQGFFIDCAIDPEIFGTGVTSVGGGMVSFNNSQRAFVRETSGNSIFMKVTNDKNTAATKESVDNRMKIRLGFDSPIGSHRQILVGTDANTTNKFDFGYDAKMIDVNKNDMYWELGKTPLIIQGIPNFNSDQIIPIGIKIENEGQSTIKIDALENIPNTLDIFVYDNSSKTYFDLRKENFVVNLAPGEYNNRFSLQFINKNFSIKETTMSNGIICYYTNENQMLNIRNYFNDVNIKTVYLFNIARQNIGKWNITDKEQNLIQIPINHVSSAVYLVLIKTDKGEFTQKIIIK